MFPGWVPNSPAGLVRQIDVELPSHRLVEWRLLGRVSPLTKAGRCTGDQRSCFLGGVVRATIM